MTTSARTGFALLAALTSVTLAVAQGGDGPVDAVLIRELPFTDAGTTVGFTDVADVVCPYTGSTSPDVWYRYVEPSSSGKSELVAEGTTANTVDPVCPPLPETYLSIDLCASGYDTKVYVLGEDLQVIENHEGHPACNDDFCTSPNGGGFRSFLECADPDPGQSVYVVVDGWLGDAGPYAITVFRGAPGCGMYHPCGFFGFPQEPEIDEPDDCAFGDLDPNDQVNGGCNASPPAFTDLPPDTIVGGTGWMDCANGVRDTDWWRVEVDVPTTHARLEIECAPAFDAVVGRAVSVDGSGGDPCDGPTALADWESMQCTVLFDARRTSAFPADGDQFVFVAPLDRVDCNQPMGGPPSETLDVYHLRVRVLPEPCPGDLDESGTTDFEDLLAVLANWGDCPGCPEDLTGDGAVGFDDMLLVLSTWGECP